MPVRVIGRIAPFTDDAFKVVNAGDLGGIFVKSCLALMRSHNVSGCQRRSNKLAQLSTGGDGAS